MTTTPITAESIDPAANGWGGQPDAPPPDETTPRHPGDRALDGAAFVLDAPDEVPAVWGTGEHVAWAAGEPLLLVGPPGVGKTTLGQQLALARTAPSGELLAMPVSETHGRCLYIAADRPSQARRSLRRMVDEHDRDRLRDRLTIWPGPLPFNVLDEPHRLTDMAHHYQAGTVVIDSLKDIAPGLEKPEVGGQVNVALQQLVAAGIEVAALHHQRKANADNTRPRSLDDVYGSTWLTAGAGSVVLLWGKAGDPVVDLHHLKQPADDIGPLTVTHDHTTGRSTVHGQIDLLTILRTATKGLTARGAAEQLYGTPEPDRNQIEKARRRLESYANTGQAHRRDGTKGGTDGGTPATYTATDNRRQEPL